MKRIALPVAGILAAFLVIAVLPYDAEASHSWGGYHWARTASSFTLKLGDNVSTTWDTYLAAASADWSTPPAVTPPLPDVLDAPVVAGAANPKNCRPTAGRVEVCDSTYGNNGWLGLAQIWVTGGTHITQGVVKLNDSYFNTAKYNNPNERLHVVCQEVGHTFGLAHQSESGVSLNTCMDYFSNTGANAGSTLSTTPNAHDYDELVTIYTHLDSTTSVGSKLLPAPATGDLNSPGEWGKLVSQSANGKTATFERDLGHGQKVLTHVYYAD